MKEVTNQRMQPVILDDGTMLAAAGTDGSTKTVASLSARDEKRLVRRQMISVVDKSLKAVSEASNRSAVAARQGKESTAASDKGGQQ